MAAKSSKKSTLTEAEKRRRAIQGSEPRMGIAPPVKKVPAPEGAGKAKKVEKK